MYNFKPLIFATLAMGCNSGCGISEAKSQKDQEPSSYAPSQIFLDDIEAPKEIKHHLAEFVYQCDASNRADLCRHNTRALRTIKYVEGMSNSVVATCWVCPNGNRHINILKGYSQPNTMVMKSLMYHELGHCLLDLKHKVGKFIMNPSLIDPESGGVRWSNMIKDFFEQEPNKDYEAESAKLTDDPNNPC
jgi:hypothetical protein